MKRTVSLFVFISLFYVNHIIAQDTLSGNYTSLKIPTGLHVIKDVVRVTGAFEVEPGAKIEMIDAGLIVCEGSVSIKGIDKNIEFFGKKNLEGIGIIIKNIDSNKVVINNTIFKGLQLPILFDFGWNRTEVDISENIFTNNVGKISVLQVLNPPFNFNTDSVSNTFKLINNLFTGNNAGIYFEDLKSDHVDLEISNNTFANNNVYGFKNYNISTNYIYGRADQINTRFVAKIEKNSFFNNFLIDNISDTIVHAANFGIYGTEKTFSLINNFWGSLIKDNITKSFHDQNLNYSSPKIEFEPFLQSPNESNPLHIYSIKNGETNEEFQDSVIIKNQLKSIVLGSNNKANYSKAVINYIYFKKDSTMERVDTVLSYNAQEVNGNYTKLDITKTIPVTKPRIGYYNIKGISGANNEIVPDVKIGYQAYLLQYRKQKIFVDSLNLKKDTVPPKPKELDSVRNQFQKIEAPQKSRIEIGLLGGGTIFKGTISNPNIFNNEMNILMGINIGYTIYSNISASLTIMSSKLSNSDYNSSNNEQISRGMSFSTSILGISPAINFDFVDNRLYTKAKRFRPSVGVGFDFISFSPTGTYKNKSYKLQPLGNGGLTKNSGDTLLLYSTAANTYSGITTINGGLVRINSTSAFGNASSTTTAHTIINGGTLLIDINGFTIAEPFTIASDGITIASVPQGSIKTLYGKNTLNGQITLGGDARINAGVGGITTDSLLLNNIVTSTSPFTLTLFTNVGTRTRGTISGAGSITKEGTDTLLVSAINTYTGSTKITSGCLLLGANYVMPSTATNQFIFNGGTFSSGGFTDTLGILNVLDNSKINIKFLPIHGLTFTGKGSFVAGKNLVIYGWSGLTAPGISKTGALIASNPSQTMIYLRPTGFMDKTKSGGLTKYGQIVSASIGADFNGRIYFSNSTSLTQFQLNRLRFYVDPSIDYTSPYNYFSSTQAASFELLANDTIKTEPVDVIPVSTLTTSTVASITNTTATGGGNITDASGDAVLTRGIIWSTTSSPTVDLSTKTVNGAGTGTFTSSIIGLTPGTLYYVRAYATNSNGTDYGSQVSFTTQTPPTLTSTTTPSSVTASTATSGGNISSANGFTMVTRGVVWSTSPNPTIALSTKTAEASTATGSFTSNITGLTGLTLYYVRSYATNTSGTDYGPEITFTTPYAPNGSNSANAAVSGVQLRSDYPSLTSGWYWIKSAIMPNALEMYVDMTEDGGGYDFYFITAGPAVSTVTATNGGTGLGLDLVMPRSKNHWKAMSNAVLAGVARGATKVGSGTYASFFQTAYGVYRETSAGNGGGNYVGKTMRHSSYGGSTNAADWRVKDGGKWWLRDDNTYGEPNGDYGLNGLLGGVSLPNPYYLTNIEFNDLTSNYSTGLYYLVSTNSKQ